MDYVLESVEKLVDDFGFLERVVGFDEVVPVVEALLDLARGQKVEIPHRQALFVLGLNVLVVDWVPGDFDFCSEEVEKFLLELDSHALEVLGFLVGEVVEYVQHF